MGLFSKLANYFRNTKEKVVETLQAREIKDEKISLSELIESQKLRTMTASQKLDYLRQKEDKKIENVYEKYENQSNFLRESYKVLTEQQIEQMKLALKINDENLNYAFLGRGIDLELEGISKESILNSYKTGKSLEQLSKEYHFAQENIERILIEQYHKGKVNLKDEKLREIAGNSNLISDYLIKIFDQTKIADKLIEKRIVEKEYRTNKQLLTEIGKPQGLDGYSSVGIYWNSLKEEEKTRRVKEIDTPRPLIEKLLYASPTEIFIQPKSLAEKAKETHKLSKTMLTPTKKGYGYGFTNQNAHA